MKQKLTKQDIGYTQISNAVLKDKKLSLKGKGLYAFLYSKPDDWDFAYNRIANELDIGDKQVRSGLQELEEVGYLQRIKHGTGRVSYYLNYDKKPSADNGHEGTEPGAQKGKQPKRLVAITGTISNTDIESNKEVETNTSGGESPPQEDEKSVDQRLCIHINKHSGELCGKNTFLDEVLCSHHTVQEIIDLFAPVNESYLTLYGNKTQHAAVKELVKTYKREELLWMIKTAPGYNKMPFRAKGDKIYSPHDLLKNWSVMKDNLISYKLQVTQKKQGASKEVVR